MLLQHLSKIFAEFSFVYFSYSKFQTFFERQGETEIDSERGRDFILTAGSPRKVQGSSHLTHHSSYLLEYALAGNRNPEPRAKSQDSNLGNMGSRCFKQWLMNYCDKCPFEFHGLKTVVLKNFRVDSENFPDRYYN